MKTLGLEGTVAWPDSCVDFYRKTGIWKNQTFAQWFDEICGKYKSSTALVDKSSRLSFEEFHLKVRRFSQGLLDLGLKPKDCAILQLANTTEFYISFLAMLRIGVLPVLALPAHRDIELTSYVKQTNAKALFIPENTDRFSYTDLAVRIKENCESLEFIISTEAQDSTVHLSSLYKEPTETVETNAGEAAFFQLSGGTTGVPKLIPRTHDDYLYSVRGSADICRLSENTSFLCCLPAGHNFPLSSPGSLGVWDRGGKVVLADNPTPTEVFPLIEQEKVTVTCLVPPLIPLWLDQLKNSQYSLASLELLQVGGARLSEEMARRIEPELGCHLQQVYGMAEGLVNYTGLDDPLEIRLKTQGKPISELDEIRIVDEEGVDVKQGEIGEVLTRGPYTIRGYFKAEEHNKSSFTEDGFYRTGDLASIDEHGNITVSGRNKDQINRGGEKIAAEEVENLLLSHEAVFDAALVAMPDKYMGEKSCAFIISTEKLRALELRKLLMDKGLADYKIPDRFEFVDSFPKTSFGKVNKKQLRKLISEKITT